MISTITSTQVYKQISPIVRKNMTHLFNYRLRNDNDLESTVEEFSAIYGLKRKKKKTFYKYIMKQLAKIIVSFYVNLMSKDKRKMLMFQFNHYLNPS